MCEVCEQDAVFSCPFVIACIIQSNIKFSFAAVFDGSILYQNVQQMFEGIFSDKVYCDGTIFCRL